MWPLSFFKHVSAVQSSEIVHDIFVNNVTEVCDLSVLLYVWHVLLYRMSALPSVRGSTAAL